MRQLLHSGFVPVFVCAAVAILPGQAAGQAARPARAQSTAAAPPSKPAGDAARKPAAAAAPERAAAPLVTYLNPEALFQSDAYSKVAVVEAPARMAYFSGSIPVDKSYNIVGRGDLRAQVKAALSNLSIAMDAAGVTKNDVVKISVDVVYKDNRDTFTVSEELVAFFERDDPPATTISGAPFLIAEGILVQIEAVAALPAQAAKR